MSDLNKEKNKTKSADLIRYAYLKKRNKRIIISVYKCEDGTVAIIQNTINLVGDWKDRRISETSIVLGMESFIFLTDIYNMLLNDPFFLKITNAERGQISKDKKATICTTNIKP